MFVIFLIHSANLYSKNKMIVEKFIPLRYNKSFLSIDKLNSKTGKEWRYASSGKAALYHCLNSLGVKGKILIPTFVCESILHPLKRMNLSYICYDINSENLNVNITDLEKKINENNIDCVIVASMYGNPAGLVEVENICKKHQILMIDDAAQGFGAKYDQKYVGTFGDAGFFSFSPGKPTAGHLGGFFWSSNKQYSIKRTNHRITHFIAYLDFYFNRYEIYIYKKYKIFTLLTYLKIILFKFFDLYNDRMNNFENSILGGILKANENECFRRKVLCDLKKDIIKFKCIKLITLGEGDVNNHKIVLLCDSIKLKEILKSKLNSSGIYVGNGYELIDKGQNCPNAKEIYRKVIEIPIEESLEKNKHIKHQLIKILNEYEYSSYNNNIQRSL